MGTFITFLILSILTFSWAFYFIGKKSAYRNSLKLENREIAQRKDDCGGGIIGCFAFSAYLIALLICGGFNDLRANYIDKWRSNEIIEQVNYEYHRINGEQVVVDSTFNYIKNPNFKK